MDVRNAKFWTEGVPVEHDALQQIRNIAGLPVAAGHVAVMPDVHVGKGATVGTVIPTRAALIPAAVGVDIGCGVCAVRTTLVASDLPDSLAAIRVAVEALVPVGFQCHSRSQWSSHGSRTELALKRRTEALHQRFSGVRILERVGKFDTARVWTQLGTLGGGNHFIELCLDEAQRVWVMLHSGSRNVGKTIGETATAMARGVALKHDVRLPDRDLAWLDEGTPEFAEYVEGLLWAQDYAALNRDMMLHSVMKALQKQLGRDIGSTEHAVNCHHNYASRETHFGQEVWVTRKGAVSARAGELGVIPGSMGARSYIVAGKGNADAYCSCSHGAGRRLSRGAAKREFTVADLEVQTAGVECRKDSGVLDEIPGAYKDIEAVMAAQAELVDIRHTLKQVMCIKG